MGVRRAGRVAGVEYVIVNYGDFTFVKDEGFIALAYTGGEGEPQVVRRIHLGDSLADTVGDAWKHRGASPEVVEKVVGK